MTDAQPYTFDQVQKLMLNERALDRRAGFSRTPRGIILDYPSYVMVKATAPNGAMYFSFNPLKLFGILLYLAEVNSPLCLIAWPDGSIQREPPQDWSLP